MTRRAAAGKFVQINSDHDEGNVSAAGEIVNDNEPNPATGLHRITPNDDDLRDAALTVGGVAVAGKWKLTFSSRIKVWRPSDADPSQWIEVASGVESAVVTGSKTIPLKIEGISLSAARNDISLTATWTPTGGTALTDAAKFTVSGVDVDVDSDNDNGLGMPEADKAEGDIEQDPSLPGKYVGINDDDSDHDGMADGIDGFNKDGVSGNADDSVANEAFAAVRIELASPIDWNVARIRMVYAGDDPLDELTTGTARLWKEGVSSRDGRSVALGGGYVPPNPNASGYSAAQLGLSGNVGTLRLEGVSATSSDEDRTLYFYVDPDGTAGIEGFELYDDCKFTVVSRTPAGVGATAIDTTGILLDWADGPLDLTRGYHVYRSTTSNFTPSAASRITTTAITASELTDTGLTPGTTYYYKVTAVDAAGTESVPSAQVSDTTPTSNTVPAAPSNLTATAISTSQVNLAWRDNANNEQNYLVQFSTDPTFATGVTSVTRPAQSTSYSVTGLTSDTDYHFRVRATNAGGESDWATATATTQPTLPAAPTNLLVTPTSPTGADLAWTDSADNERSYTVQWSTDPAFGTDVSQYLLSPNATSFTASALQEGTQYHFRVFASNNAGNTTPDEEPAITPLATPSNLSASNATDTSVDLSWSDQSGRETAYILEYSTDANFTSVTQLSLPGNATATQVAGLAAGVTYHFRLRAVSAVAQSAWVTTSAATTGGSAEMPSIPQNLNVGVASATQVNLDWSGNPEAGVTYSVYRGIVSTFPADAAHLIQGNLVASNFIDHPATAGNYYYKVRAVVSQVESAPTVAQQGDTMVMPPSPAAPSGLSFQEVRATELTLSWIDASLNESGFHVERWNLVTSTWDLVGTLTTDVTSFTDTGLTADTVYRYRVGAYNANTSETRSDEAEQRTSASPPSSDGPGAEIVYMSSDPEIDPTLGFPPLNSEYRVTFQRTSADTTNPLEIQFLLGGEAIPGIDYEGFDTVPGAANIFSFTIPAGMIAADLVLVPLTTRFHAQLMSLDIEILDRALGVVIFAGKPRILATQQNGTVTEVTNTSIGLQMFLDSCIASGNLVTELKITSHGAHDFLELGGNGLLLVVGNPKQIVDENGVDLTPRFLAALAPNASVRLQACKTGNGPDSLAAEMSRVLPGRTVSGATRFLARFGFLGQKHSAFGDMQYWKDGVRQ